MPRTTKKSPAQSFDKKECPTCHKMIDVRGYATHLKYKHGAKGQRTKTGRGVAAPEPSLPQFLTGYRKGFADGYAEALERSSKS